MPPSAARRRVHYSPRIDVENIPPESSRPDLVRAPRNLGQPLSVLAELRRMDNTDREWDTSGLNVREGELDQLSADREFEREKWRAEMELKREMKKGESERESRREELAQRKIEFEVFAELERRKLAIEEAKLGLGDQ